MIFSIDRDILLNHLNIIQKGLPVKTPMPILYAVKFEVFEDHMILTTSNTDVAIQVFVDDETLSIKSSGKGAIPGRYLIDIVRKVVSKRIEFALIEQNIVVIRADRSEFKLRLLDVEDYPDIDFMDLNDPLTFDPAQLKDIIRETNFATATSEKRPILTGVDFKFLEKKLFCVATDSYRLAQKEVAFDLERDPFDLVIPNKSLDELYKILEIVSEPVELYVNPNKVLFKMGSILFQTRLLEGSYPNTMKIIPKEFMVEIPFHKEQLLAAIDRVSLLSPKERETNVNIVRLTLREDQVVDISSTNNEIGDALEEVIPSGEVKGPQIKLAFSSKYLKEALKAFHSDEILIQFAGEIKPFIVTGKDDPALLHLILPVRLD
ncbi:MAG: DNA polymerase III subunit beta [Acholeplasmataceae bacterium]